MSSPAPAASAAAGAGSLPAPEWIIGVCPCCGGPVVRNQYYTGGHGYAFWRECWQALSHPAQCHYREQE